MFDFMPLISGGGGGGGGGDVEKFVPPKTKTYEKRTLMVYGTYSFRPMSAPTVLNHIFHRERDIRRLIYQDYIYEIKCSISSELQYSSLLMMHLHVIPSLMLIHLFPIFKQTKSQPWIRLTEK